MAVGGYNGHKNAVIIKYDYSFSTPAENVVNKRIIDCRISFPRLRRGKDIRQPL
ncbi:hypothetical protein CUS_7337 [Ruminococcus albus 8]|uniref:Uncharacterized protein n=1 Tax=Ruminococcus albus 8 TaxID=246199 RepID=E9S7W2_RUMAL|nr:hypothetical protein CUS_7337 [Ruminococcus albus 8]